LAIQLALLATLFILNSLFFVVDFLLFALLFAPHLLPLLSPSLHVDFVVRIGLAAQFKFSGSNFLAGFITADVTNRIKNELQVFGGQLVNGILHAFVNVATVDSALYQCRCFSSFT
jgi:hypothetical protein